MIDLIQRQLDGYGASNPLEEERALKEIIQEIVLYALWRADFFDVAAFQGGTSLRILHGLPRFSEDLDFILKSPDSTFNWTPYLGKLLSVLSEYGLTSEALDKSRMDQRVKKALLKDNSIANQLDLAFYQGESDRKLRIKLEIDVEPPAGSGFDYSYLEFPLDFEVCHQDLPSNFALKIHALLCRPWVKGRDWYDFNWYIKQKVSPNLAHLAAALDQYGPWVGHSPEVSESWLYDALSEKIGSIDWSDAVRDVERFLSASEQASLKLWSARFFTEKLDRIEPQS